MPWGLEELCSHGKDFKFRGEHPEVMNLCKSLCKVLAGTEVRRVKTKKKEICSYATF